MEDNFDQPPREPFYAKKPEKRRKPIRFKTQRPEYYERLRKALADELAKPVEGRIGKLKTMKSGDFTPLELLKLKRRLNLK